MELISAAFAAFTVIFLIAYYVCPKRFRWMVLLLASYCYYIIICGKYVAFILFTTASTYFGAVFIDILLETQKRTIKENAKSWSREQRKAYKETIRKKRIAIMLLVLILNFGLLGFLKYIPYASRLGFLLPLGISFYTFQSMGYLIDVYQEKVKAQTNFFKLALFVSFFPQIIQGPIAVYDDLAGQLYEGHVFDYDKLKRGALLVLWGAFKKMVIADRAVVVMNYILSDVHGFSGSYVMFAAVVYALQLYTDFSGGIDIVRGIGEMFGITMAENFRQPYFSRSLTEYWHRWHITLGNWCRNYIFYPLSISKRFLDMGKFLKKHSTKHIAKVLPGSIASVITFLVIGIWHGANMKYVAFGLWNGVVIMIAELIAPVTNSIKTKFCGYKFKILPVLWTFILVLVGYYFDIADDLSQAVYMLVKSVTDFHISDFSYGNFMATLKPCGYRTADFMLLALITVFLFMVSLVKEKKNLMIRDWLMARKLPVQWIIIMAGIFSVIIFGYYGPGINPADFVYMQF